jgi:hypothetical protein
MHSSPVSSSVRAEELLEAESRLEERERERKGWDEEERG